MENDFFKSMQNLGNQDNTINNKNSVKNEGDIDWVSEFSELERVITVAILSCATKDNISEELARTIQIYFRTAIEDAVTQPNACKNILHGRLGLIDNIFLSNNETQDIEKNIVCAIKTISGCNTCEKLTKEQKDELARNIIRHVKPIVENELENNNQQNSKTIKEEKNQKTFIDEALLKLNANSRRGHQQQKMVENDELIQEEKEKQPEQENNEQFNFDPLQNNFNGINSANGGSMRELAEQMPEQNKLISGPIGSGVQENGNQLEIINEENNEEISEKSSQKELESADEEIKLLRDKLEYNKEELEQQKREEEIVDLNDLESVDLEEQPENNQTKKEIEQNDLQSQKQEKYSENLEFIREGGEYQENKNEEIKKESNHIEKSQDIAINVAQNENNEQANQNNIEEDNTDIEMSNDELNEIYNNFTQFTPKNRNQGTMERNHRTMVMVRFDKVVNNIHSRWGIECLFSRKARLENMLYNSLNSNNNTISLEDLNEIIAQSSGCGCG